MKVLISLACLLSVLCFSVIAQGLSVEQYNGMPYAEARVMLLEDGWQAVTNKEINDTSFYAQGIYDKGYKEVLDCISMERDQCQFVLKKDKQLILITTKEKSLNVESIEFQK